MMRIRQILYVLCGLLIATPASAADMNLIRDAEIEDMLRTFAAPIQQAAGLAPDSTKFVLVQNIAINAFVAGGNNMFLYTGLLQEAKNADELIGVMAHETGHIAGGHLVRSEEEIRNASATAILATLAGVAAAAASKDGSAGAAAVSLGQQVAQRQFLQYSRTQESAADQAALSFLSRARISAIGMRDFLQRLQDQELLPAEQQVEFVRTHPLTRQRVESVSSYIENHPNNYTVPPHFNDMFARMQAKLEGFLNPRGTILKTANAKDFSGIYARSIAYHQTGDTKGALDLLAGLLQQEPKNPYLYELKGQILYESGRVAESVEPYKQAVALSGGNGLLRVGYAQALLNTDATDIAINQLEAATSSERRSPLLWRLLATAYGKQNQLGMAAYALSEEAINKGSKPIAIQQAKRAQELLPAGSPGWIRAGDVLVAAEEKK